MTQRFLKWLLRPPRMAVSLSLWVATGWTAALVLGTALYSAALHPIIKIAVAAALFVAAYVATAHITSVVRALVHEVLGPHRSPVALRWTYLVVGAALVWWGTSLTAPPVVELPQAVSAPGGLAVFVSPGLDALDIEVDRATIGVGDSNSQVRVFLRYLASADEEVRFALLGSGAAAFDQAAFVQGYSTAVHSVQGNVSTLLPTGTEVDAVEPLVVTSASTALPSEGGRLRLGWDGGLEPTLPAPWYDPESARSVTLPAVSAQVEGGASPTPGSSIPVTLEVALHLTHPLLTDRAGDLGDVGCASLLDSVERTWPNDETPGAVAHIVASSGSTQHFGVPSRCTVRVDMGSVHDTGVFLNGDLTNGHGDRLVEFSGTSATSRITDPPQFSGLTVAGTAYQVAHQPRGHRRFDVFGGIAQATGYAIIGETLLGLATALVVRSRRGRA